MWINKLYLPGYQLIRHFSHLFRHFLAPKKIFLAKLPMPYLIVYQPSHIPKIRKIYGMVAKKCSKMHIFHTFFAIFGQKNFFFKNPASSVFWNHRKLPWCQKSEKTMEPFERNPSGRTDGRTDARTDVRGQIYRTSQILWVGPINKKQWNKIWLNLTFFISKCKQTKIQTIWQLEGQIECLEN